MESRPPVVFTLVDASGEPFLADSVSFTSEDGAGQVCERWLSDGYACEIDTAGRYTVRAYGDNELLVEEVLYIEATPDGCYLENYDYEIAL